VSGRHAGATSPQLATLAAVVPGDRISPAALVDEAVRTGASSITYTFTEPTVYYELVRDTAREAWAAGLRNVLVTNGFISEAPLAALAPVIDAATVELKFFDERTYRRVARAGLQPVLDTIRLLRDFDAWVEVATPVIPGVNDSTRELREMAAFIRSVGSGVPWHLSRFFPDYRMLDHPITPADTLHRAHAIGMMAGLDYVYEENAGREGAENTLCSVCGLTVIERANGMLLANHVRRGACPACRTPVAGVMMDRPQLAAMPVSI
jgi:pyruvate formate lyase activating enzyme